MKKTWQVLKFVVYILGGGVAATVLFLICISLSIHGLKQQGQMIDRCLPLVRVIGGVFGGLLMYRSEQRLAPTRSVNGEW